MITTACNGGIVPPHQGGTPVCPRPSQPIPPERDGYEHHIGSTSRFIAEREYAALKHLMRQGWRV